MQTGSGIGLWFSRLMIGIVVAWNLQAAAIFLAAPERFAPGFELSGVPGEAAVRGVAVLFVMWNVPYLVALWHPQRHRLSLWEAFVMQMIGLLGENFIRLTLPPEHAVLSASILRFIAFDAAGVVLLAAALLAAGRAATPARP